MRGSARKAAIVPFLQRLVVGRYTPSSALQGHPTPSFSCFGGGERSGTPDVASGGQLYSAVRGTRPGASGGGGVVRKATPGCPKRSEGGCPCRNERTHNRASSDTRTLTRNALPYLQDIEGAFFRALLSNAEVAHEERVIPRDLTPMRIPAGTTTAPPDMLTFSMRHRRRRSIAHAAPQPTSQAHREHAVSCRLVTAAIAAVADGRMFSRTTSCRRRPRGPQSVAPLFYSIADSGSSGSRGCGHASTQRHGSQAGGVLFGGRGSRRRP